MGADVRGRHAEALADGKHRFSGVGEIDQDAAARVAGGAGSEIGRKRYGLGAIPFAAVICNIREAKTSADC